MSDGNGLPHGWSSATIEQLIARDGVFCDGDWVETEDQDPDGDVRLIQLADVGDGVYRDRSNRSLTKAKAQELRCTFLTKGDVLVARMPDPLGRAAIFPGDNRPSVTVVDVCIVRCGHEGTDHRLLMYFLNSPAFRISVASLQSGSTRKRISRKNLATLELPIPPTKEQHRIVEKIEELFSELDAGVAALERAEGNLKRYRASVLKAAVEGSLTAEWRAQHPHIEPASKLLERILKERRQKWKSDQLAKFTAAGKQPPKNWQAKYAEPSPPDTTELPNPPKGWCWASVDQASEVQGGIQKQPKRSPVVNAYPFLRVANVHRNRLSLDEVHKIELFGGELEKLRLKSGDLLVVEGNGSKTEIGRGAVWRGEIPNCVHQNHIIRVRFLAGEPGYLNSYWNSPAGNGRIMAMAASTSGLYTLSVTKVCSLPVPLAPLEEQFEIVSEVERQFSQIDAAERAIEQGLKRAARLRQSILKQAFEGKLVPQDPADEPASALLARLQISRNS